MSANHAGGYAYRLCKADNPGGVTESCFQKTHLKFAKASPASASSFATFPDGERKKMQTSSPEFRRDVFVGSGASAENENENDDFEWVRVPVPTCRECASAYDRCGSPLLPTPGLDYGSQWNVQVNCYAACAGSASSRETGSCPDETQFFFGNETETETLRYSGYGKNIWEWSILDTVEVPVDLEPGEYVLSWRWDCEQSAQVWQNCADVEIVAFANQTRWDVASAAAIAEVPAVARGGETLRSSRTNDAWTCSRYAARNRGGAPRRAVRTESTRRAPSHPPPPRMRVRVAVSYSSRVSRVSFSKTRDRSS
jgi:hypothetical protein